MGAEEIASWTSSKTKLGLQDFARQFLGEARTEISDPLKRQQTIDLMDVLLGDDWLRVFAAGMPNQMTGPPLRGSGEMPFEPSNWPEGGLHLVQLQGVLRECHLAYRDYFRAYGLLTDGEKQLHAPGGAAT